MIQYQILQTNITRTVWQTVRRITNEILGVKELKIENQMCLWGFFSQIAENYLTTTNSNHSMAQSIEIKFI